MSPSWRNRLYVALSPERISLLKAGRGLAPKLIAKHDEAVTSSGKHPLWQPVLDRLNGILSQPEWRNCEVDVVLSNRLVRYATIEFNAQLKNYSAQEAFARHALTRDYGTLAEQWELRIQRGKPGVPWLVAAVDKGLLKQLRLIFADHQLKLRSVRPYLGPVLERHYQAIEANPAWLVVNEPGYSLFVLTHDKRIVSLNGVSHDSADDLPLLLDRENLASSLPEACKSVYLSAPSADGESRIAKSGYHLNTLGPGTQSARTHPAEGFYAMAMSAEVPASRLQLDYQKVVDGPRRTAGWLLLLAGLALLADTAVTYDKLKHERDAMYQELSLAKTPAASSSTVTATRKFTEADFEDARQIMNRLSTPWDELFAALESIKSERVSILSVQPDVQAKGLRIDGEAKDYASALTLIAQLRTKKHFSQVFMLHHEIKRDSPQHPIGFTLSLRWGGPS